MSKLPRVLEVELNLGKLDPTGSKKLIDRLMPYLKFGMGWPWAGQPMLKEVDCLETFTSIDAEDNFGNEEPIGSKILPKSWNWKPLSWTI